MPFLSGKKRKVVNVGGHGDCGFRSVAAGIVDNFITHPHLNKDLLHKVLNSHFAYYPMHRSETTGLATSSQLMKNILAKVPLPELIELMGNTLRQLAVDEIEQNPLQYKGAFVQNHEQTSPQLMRQSETWIDETSIRALAYTLDIPIEVHIVTPGQELSVPPLRYNVEAEHSATNPNVVIELELAHYRPHLVNPSHFNAYDYSASSQIKPIISDYVDDRDMPEIMAIIALEEKRIATEFETNRMRLTAMVTAGELTKEMLLDAYIKGMGTSDYLRGREHWVNVERDDHYFSTALAEARGRGQPAHSPSRTHDEDLIIELVHGLSRALSVGLMRADDIYSLIEVQERSSHRHSC